MRKKKLSQKNFIANALNLIHGESTNLFTYNNNKGAVVPLWSQFSF